MSHVKWCPQCSRRMERQGSKWHCPTCLFEMPWGKGNRVKGPRKFLKGRTHPRNSSVKDPVTITITVERRSRDKWRQWADASNLTLGRLIQIILDDDNGGLNDR